MTGTSLELLYALVPTAAAAELAAQDVVVQDSLFPDLPDREGVGDWDDRDALATFEMTPQLTLEVVRRTLGAVPLDPTHG